MEMPAILRGDSVKRLLQGAAAGAVLTLIIGFNWGGWVTGGTAKEMVQRSASSAVVTALSPICVDKFRHAMNADENLGKLKAISYSWEKGTYVSQGGWATMPGNSEPNTAVAQACAEMLGTVAK